MKTTILNAKNVKLILDNMEIEQLAASASISLNPNVTWLKLILTDDGFNDNSQRVPKEEFANVLRTGNFMPIKMSYHGISEGHDGTFPIGVMTHLKTEGNAIHSLAALWDKERKEDIAYLKERYANNEPIDISWELTYTDTQVEDGGVALRGVAMNAATIVGLPAYRGRTPVVAISSTEQETTGEQETMEETINLAEHQRLMDEQKVSLDTQLEELRQTLSTTQTELSELKPKYDELLSFKQTIETAQANKDKLETIKRKFSESGLNVSEEYFNERTNSFLAMDEEQIDFFVQELLAAFSSKTGTASLSITSQNVPAINNVQTSTEVSPKEIVDFLRKSN